MDGGAPVEDMDVRLTRPPRHRLRVLQSFPAGSNRTNPYLLQLVAALGSAAPRTSVMFFSWRAALLGRYDVLHVHWPERLVRGNTRWRSRLKQARFLLLLLRLRVQRTPVVRTLHNLESHEPGDAVERRLLAALDRRVVAAITLNPFTPVAEGLRRYVIPHGDYRGWVAPVDRPSLPGRLLFFGLIRPYKGVEELLDAFGAVQGGDASLLIAGPPADEELTARIRARAQSDPRIELGLRYLQDADLAAEIAASELVVLPYRAVHNSGAALLALSLDRPILIPRTDTTEWLQQEVGDDWVITYDPPLTAELLTEALATTGGRTSDRPHFVARDWTTAAAAHRTVYEEARSAQRRRD